MLVAALTLTPPLGAQPARPAGAASVRTLDARLAALRAEEKALAGEQRTLLGRLRQLELTARTRALERARTTAALQVLGQSVAAASKRLAAAEAELAVLGPEVERRLVLLFKLMPLGYDRLLLSIDDARTFERAARIASVLASRDRERMETYQRLRETRRTELARLERERTELESLRARLQREEEALVEAAADQAMLLRQVRDRRDLNAQLAEELEAARDRLDRSVGSLGSGRSGGLRVAPGGLAWPIRGRVLARFGKQTSSRFGTAIVRNGIDIGAETEAPVRAVQAGRVAFADAFTGFGRVVILDHGSKAYTLYGHLAGIDVSKGDTVVAGRVLGTVGTGPSGEASLYFEVRIDGRPVDPVQWLER